MKEKHIVLGPQARAALDRGYLEDYVFMLPNPLPRPVYQEIKHALSVIGWQWNTGKQGFVFEEGTADTKILERVLETGKVLDRRQTFQAKKLEHTLDQVVASEFNKCFKKPKRLFPSAKLKNPDFYLKQVRRGIREVTKRLDELEAELHKD